MSDIVAEFVGPNSDIVIRRTRSPAPVTVTPTGKVEWKPGMEPGQAVAVPQEMVDRMSARLPAEVHKTARQRYRELVQTLYRDLRESYRDGQAFLPASMAAELGDHTMQQRLDALRSAKGALPHQMQGLSAEERKRRQDAVMREIRLFGNIEGRPNLDRVVKQLARAFIHRTARAHRELDRRSVVRYGTGRYDV